MVPFRNVESVRFGEQSVTNNISTLAGWEKTFKTWPSTPRSVKQINE